MSSWFESDMLDWWDERMNKLMWGWLIASQMPKGSSHIVGYKQEDTLITGLNTRWGFVRLQILSAVSTGHILLKCDAMYFSTKVPAFSDTGNYL
jgi:hypothetical protein